MDASNAKNLIIETFENRFDKNQFDKFIINLLDGINKDKAFNVGNAQVKEAFQKNVLSYSRIGQYTDKNGRIIDVLTVHVDDKCSLDRSRTMLRNFVADYMRQRQKDTALVAFYKDSAPDWRFSFVKLEMSLQQDDKGKVKVVNEFTPAKRYSYLVGEMEPNHTAQSRLINLLIKDYPTLEEIEESFNVEKVSKEFFANYKELFLQLVDNLKEIRKNESSQRINTEFILRQLTEANFCKKLLGQLVFLYFIQKKGWLGVPKHSNWGEGDKQFLRHTFERALSEGKNFFNDYLEPLFYDALANGERDEQIFSLLDCKIPFLNGGLFEPINGYDWVNTDIVFDNEIFSNTNKTKAGDIGDGILDVFDRYNFTVKEDEPLEKEVAVDPEMLGKVFEELLEVQDRKSKGAFYTPREIVHYMCQESLINYLCTELNASEEENTDKITKQDISDFIHHSDKLSERENIATQKENTNSVYAHILSDSIRQNAEAIDKALENIKICDPAIGSGAFPVGMLNEIVRARIALVESGFLKETKKRSVYEYKRQAIQNSIYGVDIESGAVEIAKLRLWLSLVVEEDDIENIKALPNLDYKIVCGNSLLNVPRTLFNDGLYRRLEELKPQFFNESRKGEKRRLKKEIDAIIEELTKDGTFDFEIFFSEVFHEKGGFDVVIANPPYLGESGNRKVFEPIIKSYMNKYHMSKMDLFYYFFHLALNLLISNGQCTFITTNYYITAFGARKLREDFKARAILRELINFNELKIFESALGQHNMITILQKGYNKNHKCRLVNVNRKGFIDKSFSDIVGGYDEETNYIDIPQFELYEGKENYIRFGQCSENKYILFILNKIIKNSDFSLGQICKINQGIATGGNFLTEKNKIKYNITDAEVGDGIFMISKQEYEKLALDNNELCMVKKLFKNSDINRYYTNNNNDLYLINLKYTDKPQLDNYPHIKKHISRYEKLLKDRPQTGTLQSAFKNDMWYVMTTSRKVNMDGEKIVAPQRSKINCFGYNNQEWYGATDIYYLTECMQDFSLKFILSILNSKLYYNWLYHKGKRKGETLELFQIPLSEIPIKKTDKTTQDKFVSVVDKILALTQSDGYLENQEKQKAVNEYEKQIDIMVYKLYDLTYEEVKSIDKDFSLSEEEYLAFNDITCNVNSSRTRIFI